jgi:hypothetical protein
MVEDGMKQLSRDIERGEVTELRLALTVRRFAVILDAIDKSFPCVNQRGFAPAGEIV